MRVRDEIGFAVRRGIQYQVNGGDKVFDAEHRTAVVECSQWQRYRQRCEAGQGHQRAPRNIAIEHDRPQYCERNAGCGDRRFGRKLGTAIGVARSRIVGLGQYMVGRGSALRADRGNEDKMLDACARRLMRERGGRAMVDLIEAFLRNAVACRDGGKVHDRIDTVEQSRPIKWV
jgi:hypothetical protein